MSTITRWEERVAARVHGMRGSAVRELLKVTSRPDVISFAGGLPAPDLFPVDRFADACARVLAERGGQALQYGATEGYEPLRELVAELASRHGVSIRSNNVLITTGSQQALDLIGKVFIDPGDRVVIEKPTYLGAIQSWNAYQATFHGIEIDESGLRVDRLDAAMDSDPAFVYVLPNYQNPTGATLSLSRRHELIRLASAHRLPVLEDDPYGQLSFGGDPLPPLFALDARAHGNAGLTGNVIGLGSFSKLLAPGLRLGWILAPAPIIERLALAKQGVDLHTSTLAQMIAFDVARDGFLDEHVRRLRAAYRSRRDAMLAAMDEHFPADASWTHPAGGLFLWVTLPHLVDATAVLQDALNERVAFVPGRSFFSDGSGLNTFRLNYSYAPPPIIAEGIRRLGGVLQRTLNCGPREHMAGRTS